MSPLVLPHAPASAATARRRLYEALTDAGLSAAIVDGAALVLSELVGNAVRHARALPHGGVAVAWRLAGGVLRLSVSDGGSVTSPRLRAAGPDETGGRGLAIIAHVADRWGVEQTAPETTTVWAELWLRGGG